MAFPDIDTKSASLLLAGIVLTLVVGGIVRLALIWSELSISDQAIVTATVLGSFGTLILAFATFYNILQTNRNLSLKELQQTKPLIIDELAYIIQPAIESLTANLEQIRDSSVDGCAIEWVYVENPRVYGVGREPESVQTPDSLPLARLASEDLDLYSSLRAHDGFVREIAERGTEFHEAMIPEVERLLEEAEITDIDASLMVITSSVMQRIDHFGEDNELYEFWEENRDSLLKYAATESEVTIEEMEAAEKIYREMCEDTLKALKQRKAKQKQEYRISEDEIASLRDIEL